MIILASDTSTKSLSVSITDDAKVLFSHTENTGFTHSQKHMPLIQRALEDAHLNVSDIDLFACTVGPGSYTGIRINIGSFKTVAYFAGKGAIGVSTLAVLAHPYISPDSVVCPVIDARARRVFTYADHNGTTCFSEKNLELDELFERIVIYLRQSKAEGKNVKNIVFCGDASEKISTDIQLEKFTEKCKGVYSGIQIGFHQNDPDARDLAAIARERYEAGATADPFELNANYISASQAERYRKNNSGSEYSVREAGAADIESLERLEKECSETPWSKKSLLADISDNDNAIYLIAECEGKAVGYIAVHVILDEAQIVNLAVEKSSRRKGYASALIKAVQEILEKKDNRKIFLEVRPSNDPAISLYLSEGFESVSIRRDYYRDNGENAIIMLKYL